MKLLARGRTSDRSATFAIHDGQTVILGRAPAAGLAIPWDLKISREHAQLHRSGSKLTIRRLPSARNPVYVGSTAVPEAVLRNGATFTIGETSFSVVAERHEPPDTDKVSMLAEHSFSRAELRKFQFSNAEVQLQALSQLPEQISGSSSDEELALELVRVLLDGLPRANAAAIIAFADPQSPDIDCPAMMRWESRRHDNDQDDNERFRPSRRLIELALRSQESKLHIWNKDQDGTALFTLTGNVDWAFCTPIRGTASQGWCLYVNGKFGDKFQLSQILSADDLKGDLRFAEVVSEFAGAVRQVSRLERQQAGMNQFFSPAIRETLTKSVSFDEFEPRETDITVLFCDVRGFSRKTEKARNNLREILSRVTGALEVMTRGIIEFDGIVADFQGDAALGFWGWPRAPEDGPLPACRAALAIHAEFQQAAQDRQHPLSDFRVGIGVAHGRAIAGKIGTIEQAKVGVFGPVVNLGSRLEAMTKQLRAPILLDEVTADWVRRTMPPSEGRCRRLATLRPYGMDTPLTVSELLPPAGTPETISDEMIELYQKATDVMAQGHWNDALELLNRLPATDRAKDFLMIYIAQNNYEPPPNWDGVIAMASK